MGATQHDLVSKMRLALADPGQLLDFYRALADAVLYVPGEPGPEDAFRPAMFTAEGKTVMLAFTSEERLHGYRGVGASDSPQAFSTRGEALLAQVAGVALLLVDPGSDPSIAVDRALAGAIADRSAFRVDEATFNGDFYSGPVPTPRGELKGKLREVLTRHPAVRRAFMTIMFAPASGNPPQIVVGLDADDPAQAVAAPRECVAVLESLDEEGSAYVIGDDLLSQYAVTYSSPFYLRAEPGALGQTAMTQAELIDFLDNLPASPPSGSALYSAFLAGPAPEEALGRWLALPLRDRRRYGSFASYALNYSGRQESELDVYRAASTHRQAQATLLEVLRADGEYALFLRTSPIDYTPSSASAWAPWGSEYALRLDTAVSRLLEQVPFPIAGLANPREPASAFSSVPIPQLVVRTEDWLQVITTLVAHATFVLLAVTRAARQIGPELRAIQQQGREESTMIVVPSEEDLDVSALRVLRGHLAAFGMTISPDELSTVLQARFNDLASR